MNEIQMYETLKGMPKETLIRYAQNPTGGVPQYMAIAALQYQKSIENSQPVKQPQGTVAQEVVRDAFGIPSVRHGYNQQPQQEQQPQQPQPQEEAPPEQPQQMAQGGLAALDVPDSMYQEAMLAGGGIIAFDEGGHVPGFARGAFITNAPDIRAIDAQMRDISSQLRQLGGFFGLSQQTPEQQRQYEALQNKLQELTAQRALLVKSNQPETITSPLGRSLFGAPKKPSPDFETVARMVSDLPSAAQQKQPPAAGPGAGTGITQPRLPSVGGDLKPYSITPFTPETIPTTQTQKELEDAEKQAGTWDEFLARQSEKRSSAGIKDVYEKQFGDIVKEQNKIAQDKEVSGWMAALEAGLAITAGTSPYALQNLGAGALKGISSYKDALKEIKQNEKELRREGNALQRDQQTMLESRLRGDETSYQAALDRVQGRRDKLQQIDAQNTVIKNAANEYTAKEGTEASKIAFVQGQENKRSQAQIAAHIQAAQISADATTRAALAKILAGQQLDPLEKGRLNKLADEAYDAYVGDPANKGKTLMSRETYKQNYFATMGSGGMGGRAPATGKLIAGKDGVLKYSDEES